VDQRFPRRENPSGFTRSPDPAAPVGLDRLAAGAVTTTATGHRASLARCRCGLPLGGEGLDPAVDPEPVDVRTVTVLGHVPGVARLERREDGLWHTPRTRYQQAGPPLPWAAVGVCPEGRRHRVVAVG
jgi:hypothetical protein